MSQEEEPRKKFSAKRVLIFASLSLGVGYLWVFLSTPDDMEPVQKTVSRVKDKSKKYQPLVDRKSKNREDKVKTGSSGGSKEPEVDEESLGFAYSEVLNSFELAVAEKNACEEAIKSYRNNGILDGEFNIINPNQKQVERFLMDAEFINYQETSEAELNFGFFANDFLEAAEGLGSGFKPVYFQYKRLYCDFDLQRLFLSGVLRSAPSPLKEKFSTMAYARLCQKFGHTTHPGVLSEYFKELDVLLKENYEDPAFAKFYRDLGNEANFYRNELRKKMINQRRNDPEERVYDRENWNPDALRGFLSLVDDNEEFSKEINEFLCGKLPRVLEIDQELRRTLPED